MEEIKQMLRALLERAEITDAKLDALSTDVNRLSGNVVGLTEEIREFKTETNAQLDFIAGKLGEHDRDLYVLKRRTP